MEEARAEATGVEIIRRQLRTMPLTPGVYRMVDRHGQALYVGKARSLRRRVSSYTKPDRHPYRLRRMISETGHVEVITTHTEVEALLLEINLIKRLRPRYNVLLRDDKSFPYILIADDHEWPRILKHRGAPEPARQVFRAVRVGRFGQSDLGCASAGLPAAVVFGFRIQFPDEALPPLPDQTLLGAVRREGFRRGLPHVAGRGSGLPLRREQGGAGGAVGADAGGVRCPRI